eukprot:scaffold20049_cov80-Skeletonema_marinoi.AAC.2
MKLLKLEEAYGFELFHFFARTRTRKIRHAVVRTSASGRKQGTAFFRILRIPVEFNSYRKIILIAPKLGSCRENFFQIHIRKPRQPCRIHTTIRGERVIFTCV